MAISSHGLGKTLQHHAHSMAATRTSASAVFPQISQSASGHLASYCGGFKVSTRTWPIDNNDLGSIDCWAKKYCRYIGRPLRRVSRRGTWVWNRAAENPPALTQNRQRSSSGFWCEFGSKSGVRVDRDQGGQNVQCSMSRPRSRFRGGGDGSVRDNTSYTRGAEQLLPSRLHCVHSTSISWSRMSPIDCMLQL